MSELDAPILRVVEAYRAAVHAKDVGAFTSLYHPDVRVFDMWGEWSYEGLAAWRRMVSDWFSSLGTERVAVDLNDLKVTRGQDVCVVHAFITYRGLSAEGAELRAIRNRVTWVLKQEGGWKIFHEHTSAPADFATLKVKLQS